MLKCILVSNAFNTQYDVCSFLFISQASSTLSVPRSVTLAGYLFMQTQSLSQLTGSYHEMREHTEYTLAIHTGKYTLGELPRLEQQLSEALAQGEQLRQELQARYREADEREGEKQLRENLAQAESNAEESRRRLEEIEAQATRLAAELEHREEELLRAHKDTELQIYRAVDTERQKWEKREERLIEQISLLQAQLRSSETEKLRDEEFAERRSQSSDDRHGEETSSPGTESPGQQTRRTSITGGKVQNNIGCCSIKSLTSNFCFPPTDNFEVQFMHWLLSLKKY